MRTGKQIRELQEQIVWVKGVLAEQEGRMERVSERVHEVYRRDLDTRLGAKTKDIPDPRTSTRDFYTITHMWEIDLPEDIFDPETCSDGVAIEGILYGERVRCVVYRDSRGYRLKRACPTCIHMPSSSEALFSQENEKVREKILRSHALFVSAAKAETRKAEGGEFAKEVFGD